jgi:CHASE2 domain-containing sensor protein
MSIIPHVSQHVTYLAMVNGHSFDWVKQTALGLVGSLVIVVLLVRSIGAFLTQHWGQMASAFAGAVIVGGFCFDPAGTTALIKGIAHHIGL